MGSQISFYTEKGHADKKFWPNFMINPLKAYWGYESVNDWGIYADQYNWLKDLFKPVYKIEKADAVFLPFTLNYYVNTNNLRLVDEFIELAKSKNKKIFVWEHGDYQINYKRNDCIFLKYFSYRSIKSKNDFIMPANMYNDILHQYKNGELKIKNKMKIPSVGFDGIASTSISKVLPIIFRNIYSRIKNLTIDYKYIQEHILPPMLERKRILNKIASDDKIETDFNYRDKFAVGIVQKDDFARKQYINSIIKNDYSFCYRGAGNYSMRFFEVLCLGRIPIFINTDCILPFEDEINWKEILIWVEERDIRYINEIILNYHNDITKKEFIDRQVYCRDIWLKYCSTQGLYKQLYKLMK